MTPERWQLIKAINLEAQELSPIERAAYLQHACEGDADLQAEVRSLLARGHAAGDTIEQMVGAATCLAVESEDADCGLRIGRYELIREIGRGGIGVVYLAKRS